MHLAATRRHEATEVASTTERESVSLESSELMQILLTIMEKITHALEVKNTVTTCNSRLELNQDVSPANALTLAPISPICEETDPRLKAALEIYEEASSPNAGFVLTDLPAFYIPTNGKVLITKDGARLSKTQSTNPVNQDGEGNYWMSLASSDEDILPRFGTCRKMLSFMHDHSLLQHATALPKVFFKGNPRRTDESPTLEEPHLGLQNNGIVIGGPFHKWIVHLIGLHSCRKILGLPEKSEPRLQKFIAPMIQRIIQTLQIDRIFPPSQPKRILPLIVRPSTGIKDSDLGTLMEGGSTS